MMAAILTAILALPNAWAGGYGQGNGGNTVVCAGARGEKSPFVNGQTLLDLGEGAVGRGLTYKTLASLRGLSLKDAFARSLKIYFSRVPEIAQFHANAFRRQKIEFFDGEMNLLPGSRSPYFGRECRIRQAAVQWLPTVPWGEGPLRISRQVWNGDRGAPALSTDLKVALLVHEFMLRVLRLRTGSCSYQHLRGATAFALSDQALTVSFDVWSKEVLPFCGRDIGATQ